MPQTSSRAAGRLAVLPVLVTVVVFAAGCGSGSSSSASAPASTGATGGTGSGRNMPGTSGEIADIAGATLQVQYDNGQVAVTYTATTSFRQEATATAADVKVGSCVSVTSSGTTTTTGPIAASRVSITEPTNGSCSGGFGGGSGAGIGGGAGNGTPPSGAPGYGGRGTTNGTPPSGSPRRFGAFGTVTAVSPGGFTVQSTRPTQAGSSAAPSSESVTTNGATIYSKTVSAGKSALQVGKCVTALGKTDDTGTVTATAITLRAKTAAGCSTGRGFGGSANATGTPGNGQAASGQGAAGNEQ
jgi:hypothetical protein